MTIPSVNLTLSQFNNNENLKNQLKNRIVDDNIKPKLDEFEKLIEHIEILRKVLIKYEVPIKSSYEKDGYVIAWPII